jgi:small subunit ribosomal protein S1
MITEFGEKGRNIVLSNRAVLVEEQDKKKVVLKETLKEGSTVSGTVISIRDFGAFIDIDGAEGLVPISEIGWGRVENINEYISVGQQVEVEVMKLDWEKDRLSFSLKAKQPDPWDGVAMKYTDGSIHTGTVSRLAKFGAFITLESGIDGLLHISRIGGGKRINHPGDVLKTGQEISVKVEKLDLESKRISLVMDAVDSEVDEKERLEEYKQINDNSDFNGKSTESFGTLGDILKSKLDKMKK